MCIITEGVDYNKPKTVIFDNSHNTLRIKTKGLHNLTHQSKLSNEDIVTATSKGHDTHFYLPIIDYAIGRYVYLSTDLHSSCIIFTPVSCLVLHQFILILILLLRQWYGSGHCLTHATLRDVRTGGILSRRSVIFCLMCCLSYLYVPLESGRERDRKIESWEDLVQT